MGQTNAPGEAPTAYCTMCNQKFPLTEATTHWCMMEKGRAMATSGPRQKTEPKGKMSKEELAKARDKRKMDRVEKHQDGKAWELQIERELEKFNLKQGAGSATSPATNPFAISNATTNSFTYTSVSTTPTSKKVSTANSSPATQKVSAASTAQRASNTSPTSQKKKKRPSRKLPKTSSETTNLSLSETAPKIVPEIAISSTLAMPLVDLNLLSSTEILEILKKDVKDPQNIISLPLDQTTRESLREALRLVDKKARQFRPSDDRVLGQIDIIKSALNAPSFSEKVPSDKTLMMRWLFKLQLSYIRLRWDWKAAYRFKTKAKLESVELTEELTDELLKMSFSVEAEKTSATPDYIEPTYGSRLTRANSRGLNRKLDFNYFVTPLPLERGLVVPTDKFWDPLDEKELWPNQIYGPTPIVIDSGSQYTKIGDAGNEFPRYVIPSVVATLRANKSTHKAGFDALRYIGQNSTKWRLDRAFDPMEPDWDCALALWEHAFLELLQIDVSQHPIMMTETPDMGAIGREETMEIMFEYFGVPSLCIGNTALMSLYGVGQVNGLVVDIGNRMQVVPVNNGIIEHHAIFQLRKGVTHINKYLSDLLEEKGYYFQTATEKEEVREIKEKFCYLPLDYEEELQRPENEIIVEYKRQSGEVIYIGKERFKCPELLFNPLKLGIIDDQLALPQVIVEAVMKCPIETRTNLLSNMILVGGGTLIPGMAARLEEDVFKALQKEHNLRALRRGNVHCIPTQNRKYLAWRGASVFATTEGWHDRCTQFAEYQEVGKEFLAQKSTYF